MSYCFEYKSPIGILVAISDGESLTWLGVKGQKYFEDALEEVITDVDLPIFADTRRWLDSYFSGLKPTFTPPIAPQGGEFRQTIWSILCEIPYGEVITYGDIAKLVARQKGVDKMSAQAVGGAVGHNPISIIIPCHRVVGAGGNLTGFASGIDIKIRLLELEQIDMSRFYIPKSLKAI